MNKLTFAFMIGILLLGSCNEKDDPTTCGGENPTEDLAWLKSLIENSESDGLAEYAYLIQATYKGRTVFSMASCCPFCRSVPLILDCQGNVVEDVSLNELENQQVIWRPENSVCNLD
jgi:hypothetical protein